MMTHFILWFSEAGSFAEKIRSLILSSFRREAFAFISKYCYLSTFQEISNQFRNQGIFLKFWGTGPSGLPQFEKVFESVSGLNVEIFIFVMIRKL